MKLRPVHIFLSLSLLFILYSSFIYFSPQRNNPVNNQSTMASNGKMVWQKYNCQACHQIYGLGGYLGPDLTNVYSSRKQNESLLKAIIISGNRWMPVYNLDEKEMTELICFLKTMDASGKADPREFKISNNGMIHPK